jgi:hypothetical protein
VTYIIKVYGESCDCYVSSLRGECDLRMCNGVEFESVEVARGAAQVLHAQEKIGRWEIKRAAPKYFPSCS